jgi:hypothetical protein
LKCAEHFSATDFDGADLSDQVVGAVAASGFQVDDTKRNVVQRAPELVERSLVRISNASG